MFKDVVRFKDQAFFESHRYFEIYTPERTIHLKTLGCYYSDSNGIVRKTSFKSQASFDKWVSERLAPCSFAEVPEQPFDSMFVLVTCSYEQNDARTLLFAAEVDEDGQLPPGYRKKCAGCKCGWYRDIGGRFCCSTDKLIKNFEFPPGLFPAPDCNIGASVV